MNLAVIIGNLGADPELKFTQGGQAVCNLSVATSRTYLDRNDTKIEEVEWHRVVVWGKRAEACNEYLTKGRQVIVRGRISTRKWEDEKGVSHYSTSIVAEEITFGSKPKGAGEKSEHGPRPGGGKPSATKPKTTPTTSHETETEYIPATPDDDEIPF